MDLFPSEEIFQLRYAKYACFPTGPNGSKAHMRFSGTATTSWLPVLMTAPEFASNNSVDILGFLLRISAKHLHVTHFIEPPGIECELFLFHVKASDVLHILVDPCEDIPMLGRIATVMGVTTPAGAVMTCNDMKQAIRGRVSLRTGE